MLANKKHSRNRKGRERKKGGERRKRRRNGRKRRKEGWREERGRERSKRERADEHVQMFPMGNAIIGVSTVGKVSIS